jgi:hypothetical protein
MSKQIRDAAMVDTVYGYCAKYNLEVTALDGLTFGEVIKKLAGLCQHDPVWIYASEEVRRYYPICHPGCHIERIKAFVANDCEWTGGTGPNMAPEDVEMQGGAPASEVGFPDNVVPFNATKH